MSRKCEGSIYILEYRHKQSCARILPFTLIYANELKDNYTEQKYTYIYINSHFTQVSVLVLLPEQFPVSALPR